MHTGRAPAHNLASKRGEGAGIDVIIHYPRTERERNELRRRVAEAHAQAAAQYIERLSCPKAQKLYLLEALHRAALEQAERDDS